MPTRSVKPIQRIQPSSREDGAPVDQGAPELGNIPDHGDESNITQDSYGLQEQLNRLEKHFGYLRSQLRQAQKLASLGTITAMIAHEFNNFFTPIVAYAQYALDNNDVELMRKALQRTLDNTTTMREMTDKIIGLAKQPDDVIKAVKIKEVVKSALTCLGRDLSKDNIDLNIQIDSDLSVRANDNQLLQVVYNLIINARQAMLGRGGRLAVDAVCEGDDNVVINVRDSGCGISPENLPYIFEAFFSTKQHADNPSKRGLGLGLTICRDIIEDLGGKVAVSSEEGVGTTFTIHLPKLD